MTETKPRGENKSSSMANEENCKYKTVGCQVSSQCEEMKYLKDQIESLKEQIRIKNKRSSTENYIYFWQHQTLRCPGQTLH